MEVLRVTSNSVEVSWNSSVLPSTNHNVTCLSSNSPLRNHLVTVLDITTQSVSQLTVQPLAPSTNYTCCLERINKPMIACSDDFFTSGSTGLSPEVAGVVGGVVGTIVTLLLIAGITGIAIGTAILIRRKR